MKQLALVTLFFTSGPVMAQNYSITSYTIDGGGASVNSAVTFTLSGTLGQPDAGGLLNGASLELTGGFWPGKVTQPTCDADIAAPFGTLNFFDVAAFIALFNAQDLTADLDSNGTLNFFDIASYISSYTVGCP